MRAKFKVFYRPNANPYSRFKLVIEKTPHVSEDEKENEAVLEVDLKDKKQVDEVHNFLYLVLREAYEMGHSQGYLTREDQEERMKMLKAKEHRDD